ncbi:MAG: hypothetical protein LZF62_430197 [Nitrospira sp.]|nr:MAG: hypothetical protein LZF62_430197 [Nitrospira sp.]
MGTGSGGHRDGAYAAGYSGVEGNSTPDSQALREIARTERPIAVAHSAEEAPSQDSP